MNTPTPEQYTVTLRALPNAANVPSIVRLRKLLKYALRACGLKAVRCEPGGTASDNGKVNGRVLPRGNSVTVPVGMVPDNGKATQ